MNWKISTLYCSNQYIGSTILKVFYDTMHCHHAMMLVSAGWLLKLHECLVPNGVAIVSTSDQWNTRVLQDNLSKWLVNVIVLSALPWNGGD